MAEKTEYILQADIFEHSPILQYGQLFNTMYIDFCRLVTHIIRTNGAKSKRT